MFPVRNRSDQRLGNFRVMSSVTALLRPLQYKIPMGAKDGISIYLFQARQFQISNFDQVPQIMRMARIYFFLVWEFVTLCSPCDAGLQCAFNRITGKVIRAVRKAGSQKGPCLRKPDAGKNL